MNKNEDAFIVCREEFEGQVSIKEIGFLVNDDISLNYLTLRQRYNPELEYYAFLGKQLESNKDYIYSLIEKRIESSLYTNLF